MEESSLPIKLINYKKGRITFMWEQSVEILNPYEALKKAYVQNQTKNNQTKKKFSNIFKLIKKLWA